MTEQYPSTEFFLCFIMRSLWQSARRSWASSARSTTSSTSFPATCMTPRQLRHCGSMVSSLARSVNYKMNEDDIQRCINTDGFTYMQAFPSEGQYVKPGFEELETCIRYLRERKVSSRSTAARALSLRRTQRASRPREARASLSEAPLLNCTTRRKKLVELIREYKKAAQN